MERPRPSVSTRTAEYAPRNLPFTEPPRPRQVTPPPRLDEVRRARSERIRAALRRWLEEEL
jgi:hypothetical protein